MRIATVEILSRYLQRGYNILLVGRHGVGKTSILKQACEHAGMTSMFLNGSTMDPYLNLVGVPEVVDAGGKKVLKMIRDERIDSSEMIFIDELNRGSDAVMNGVMEMINEKSINGEPLKNLKSVVSSINPPDGEYNVATLDSALMDRFHVCLTLSDRVNREYILAQFPDHKDVANVFVDWQHSLNFEDVDERSKSKVERAPYVSPRTVERLIRAFIADPLMGTIRDFMKMDNEALALSKLFRDAKMALDGQDVGQDVDQELTQWITDVVTSQKPIEEALRDHEKVEDSVNTKVLDIIEKLVSEDKAVKEPSLALLEKINDKLNISSVHHTERMKCMKIISQITRIEKMLEE